MFNLCLTYAMAWFIMPRPLGLQARRHILVIAFGGDGYAPRAARVLGCKPNYVRNVVYGCQAMPRRWWHVLATIGPHAKRNLDQSERQAHHAAVDREIDARLAAWATAEAEIARMMELFRRERVRKGLE